MALGQLVVVGDHPLDGAAPLRVADPRHVEDHLLLAAASDGRALDGDARLLGDLVVVQRLAGRVVRRKGEDPSEPLDVAAVLVEDGQGVGGGPGLPGQLPDLVRIGRIDALVEGDGADAERGLLL